MGDQPPLTESPSARAQSVPGAIASSVRRAPRIATSPSIQPRPAPRTGRRFVVLAIILLLSVGLGATWTLLAQRELASSTAALQAAQLDRARVAYDNARSRTQANLQAVCQLLVEDPRLKATLANENMSAATVEDILSDLSKLRGGGFFMVLSPDARVFAEHGAKELSGLDLSKSSLVKRAESESKAAVGSWVLGSKVVDLAIMAIRYGDNLVAYLAVGQVIEKADVDAIASECGCDVATVLGNKIDITSSQDSAVKDVFGILAAEPGTSRARVMSGHVASSFDLADVTQTHRLVAATAVTAARPAFERLGLLLWAPPVLVLLAVLFALSANRTTRRSS